MDASQLKKLSESYATIAEGGKHEKSAMDWNKKDDNPEGKKVDKKKVDKCTCESFYLKRLKAMNPAMAEKYLAIAEILISEGHENSRLIDNLVEALPKEVVGEDFRAALKAVNPKIYENLDTAEKRQARAILESAAGMSSGRQMTAAQNAQANSVRQKLATLTQRVGNFLNPPRSMSNDPVVRAGGSYTAFGGGPKFPNNSQGKVGGGNAGASTDSGGTAQGTAPATPLQHLLRQHQQHPHHLDQLLLLDLHLHQRRLLRSIEMVLMSPELLQMLLVLHLCSSGRRTSQVLLLR